MVVQSHEHPLARYARQSSLARSLVEASHHWRAGQMFERADMLLFSSRWTQQQFADLEGWRPDVGRVVPLAGWPDAQAEVAERFDPAPYVATVASHDRRDSLGWGLEAWKAARFPPSWRLMVIGRLNEGIRLPDGVEAVGWVSDQELRMRLAQAAAYLHLGQVEGFGIGVVEALQLGVPVVAPARSALPELLTDGGGQLVMSAAQAGEALRAIASDPSFRDDAFEVGNRYRWRYTAEQLLEAFAQLG